MVNDGVERFAGLIVTKMLPPNGTELSKPTRNPRPAFEEAFANETLRPLLAVYPPEFWNPILTACPTKTTSVDWARARTLFTINIARLIKTVFQGLGIHIFVNLSLRGINYSPKKRLTGGGILPKSISDPS